MFHSKKPDNNPGIQTPDGSNIIVNTVTPTITPVVVDIPKVDPLSSYIPPVIDQTPVINTSTITDPLSIQESQPKDIKTTETGIPSWLQVQQPITPVPEVVAMEDVVIDNNVATSTDDIQDTITKPENTTSMYSPTAIDPLEHTSSTDGLTDWLQAPDSINSNTQDVTLPEDPVPSIPTQTSDITTTNNIPSTDGTLPDWLIDSLKSDTPLVENTESDTATKENIESSAPITSENTETTADIVTPKGAKSTTKKKVKKQDKEDASSDMDNAPTPASNDIPDWLK